MMQSTPSLPSLKGALNTEIGKGKLSTNQKRSQSASQLDIAEVRALAKDQPYSAEQDTGGGNKSEHGVLMMRLKSREARAKAESNRDFLAQYRKGTCLDPKADDRLDKLLRDTAQRADDLRLKSEELQAEAADAERTLERANAKSVNRVNEQELQAMNAFERSTKRIQEDKQEEELQKKRDDAQANYVRVHRRLQNELIELRDYKVLLVEFRRLRLEKLQETLGRVQDGRRLRACVREMIRHGAQRILNRLETASVPLETWMREVLVNSCHLELRIEDAEGKLLKLRRQALGPVKSEITDMVASSKQERFEALCARTWDSRRKDASDDTQNKGHRSHEGEDGEGEDSFNPGNTTQGGFNKTGQSMAATGTAGSMHRQESAGLRGTVGSMASTALSRVPDDIAAEMHTAEADITAVKRLLSDMRGNAAAVICHQIREAEKTGGRDVGSASIDVGFKKLKLLVNEDFAKITMKELQKSAPQGKFGKPSS